MAKMSVGRPTWKVYLQSRRKAMVTYPKMGINIVWDGGWDSNRDKWPWVGILGNFMDYLTESSDSMWNMRKRKRQGWYLVIKMWEWASHALGGQITLMSTPPPMNVFMPRSLTLHVQSLFSSPTLWEEGISHVLTLKKKRIETQQSSYSTPYLVKAVALGFKCTYV